MDILGFFGFFAGLALWVLIATLPAIIAEKKGHSFWLFFFVSLFFWWITLFWALFMEDRSKPTKAA